MWPSDTDGIDLLELNRRLQMRQARMTQLFFFEVDPVSRAHLWLRILPFLLENTAPIQNLGGHRKVRLGSLGFFRPLFPHCAEISGGVVLIDWFQVPSQNNCGKRQSAKEFFKIGSDGSLAFQRLDSAKCRQKLWIELPKQPYFSR
jgi:hypothetical protein